MIPPVAPSRRHTRQERGYVLLSLLLGASLLVITAAALAPKIALQIRRDQEEELIHRATQYRRAIRRFTKQTGRFPMTLEDLDNTNGVRFLRRRYKDPITGKDFKVLRMSETPAALGTSANAWSLQPAANGNASDSAQESSDPAALQAESGQSQEAAASTQPNPIQQNSEPGAGPSRMAQPAAASSSSGNGTVSFGLIIGVVSTSKAKTIREFNQKNRYNQWYFFYDPTFDRGFEVQGPTPLTRPPANLQGAPNSSNQANAAAQSTPTNAPQ